MWQQWNRAEARLVSAVPGLPDRPAPSPVIAVTAAGRAGALWVLLCAIEAVRSGGNRRGARHGILAVGVALCVSHLIKRLMPDRRRPEPPGGVARHGLPERPDSSSFPSAHAATAAAFTVVLVAHDRRMALLVAPLPIMAVYGRLRTRVHWPSDVLAGMAIGIGAALSSGP
jgi:membrane-associated phospholipid phosphatase